MAISLCMIVKDEASILEQYIKHHIKLYDELVIVDTGSKDNTVEIAKKYTNKVFKFEWQQDFSQARNFSISKASKEWVLWLDPDEEVEEKYFPEIKKILTEIDAFGLSFIQKNFTNVKQHPRYENSMTILKGVQFSGYYVRRICKLFRNFKNIEFHLPIHETVKESIKSLGGKIIDTNFVIKHFPEIKSKEFLITKEREYLRILENKRKSNPGVNVEKEILSEKAILDFFVK